MPDSAEPSIRVQEQHDADQRLLIARRGRTRELAAAIAKFLERSTPLAPLEGAEHRGVCVFATEPMNYWVLADSGPAKESVRSLQELVSDYASVFDQSHSHRIFLLSGEHVCNVLEKGTPLDLRSSTFRTLSAAHTKLAEIPVIVVRRPALHAYAILVPRSYVASFHSWLKEAILEYSGVAAADDSNSAEQGRHRH